MNTRIYLLVLASGSLFTALSCKEERHAPLTGDAAMPASVSEVTVENLPGAARLTYTLPSDRNLFYVKAEFETQGKKRDVRATYYNNTLLLEGFGDTLNHEVRVFSVNRSEKHSEPVVINVNPLTPPVRLTYRSLAVEEAFGGATVRFINSAKENLSLTIMHRDSSGSWITDEVLYTEKENGDFAARGLRSVPTTFGIYIRDRWGNYSDTLVTELTPLFEEELDKSKFKPYILPTDETALYRTSSMDNIWDGDLSGPGADVTNTAYIVPANSGVPNWFTFDLGAVSKLSRFLYQQRYEQNVTIWGDANPRYFEIWGSAETPAPDGSWDGWTKLMDVESVKPSGFPLGQNSDEDLALLAKGEEFTFPSTAPAVRYIRIRINETWGKQQHYYFSELTFWGQ